MSDSISCVMMEQEIVDLLAKLYFFVIDIYIIYYIDQNNLLPNKTNICRSFSCVLGNIKIYYGSN